VKKLLNTLYVTTEGAGLRKDGENLVAEIDGTERTRLPLHMLGSVVVFGATYISPPLIGALARGGVTIVPLDRQGRFEARIEGPVSAATYCCAARNTAPPNNPTTSCAGSSPPRSPISEQC
jgi:CRISP-associated protein Cas1